MSRRSPVGLVRFSIALALSLLFSVPSARAGDWLPLAIGNRWEYVDGLGGSYAEQITSSFTLLGRTVFVKSYIGGPDDGLMNWWLSDADGSVYLAGFDNHSAGLSLAYDPPIEMLAAPPVLGATWHTPAIAYELPGMTVFANLDIHWQVLEDVVLTVPAGDFHSFGVGEVPAAGARGAAIATSIGQEFTLDGRRRLQGAQTLSDPRDWYAENVGDVQLNASGLWKLSWYGNPTPVARTTWGAIKQLYR